MSKLGKLARRVWNRVSKFNNRYLSTIDRHSEKERKQIGEIESKVSDYYNNNTHYDSIWGDRIHIGYFGDCIDQSDNDNSDFVISNEEWQKGTIGLTHEMCKLGLISNDSIVCDFGCGKGQSLFDILNLYSSINQLIGIDLSIENINYSCQMTKDLLKSENNISFVQGSFIDPNLKDILSNINSNPFTHVLSQFAICHVSDHFDQVVKNIHSILDGDNGIFINCDIIISGDEPSDRVYNHFYQRMKLNKLLNEIEYINICKENGLYVDEIIDLSKHAYYGYDYVEKQAMKYGFDQLADHYFHTKMAFKDKELRMPIIVAKMY